MNQATINEPQADMAAWVRQVVLAKQIILTGQGRPVATLVPLPAQTTSTVLLDREELILSLPFMVTDSAEHVAEMSAEWLTEPTPEPHA